MAVPHELNDMPIPPGSDPRKRRATKAAAVAASSGSSQTEGSRAVAETPTQQNSMADEPRTDVEGGERRIQKFEITGHPTPHNNKKRSIEDSRMDDEGEKGDEFRSSAVPNTRRLIATTTPLEENTKSENMLASTC